MQQMTSTEDIFRWILAGALWVKLNMKIWALPRDFQQCGMGTSKGSDQPAHTRRLIRAFASRLNILWLLSYWPNIICCF